MHITYELTRYDRRQRIVKVVRPAQSESFVKAFLQLLYVEMSENSQAIIDIDNTSRTIVPGTSGSGKIGNLRAVHPGLSAGEDFGKAGAYASVYADDCGIQVGTSATAVAVADDNLVAPVVNGTGAGQMVYYGCYGLNYNNRSRHYKSSDYLCK